MEEVKTVVIMNPAAKTEDYVIFIFDFYLWFYFCNNVKAHYKYIVAAECTVQNISEVIINGTNDQSCY
jgi:hypothetical protein